MADLFTGSTLLLAEEVGEKLRVQTTTVWRWVYEKKIPYIKIGIGKKSPVRFDPEQLNRWLIEKSKNGSCEKRSSKSDIM